MYYLPDDGEKGEYIKEIFNAIAVKYDFMNSLMTLGLDKYWRKLAVDQLEINIGDQGLDICCCTGMLTIELARRVGDEGHIIGVDFSDQMLLAASKNIQKYKKSITVIKGNAVDLPFSDNIFQFVTVGWGLRNVSEIYTAIKEMVRVVKTGGKIISLDTAKPLKPIFKHVYWQCFQKIVPTLGQLFSPDKRAYEYLYESARAFHEPEKLAELFQKAGMNEVKYKNLCGGIIAIVEGRKE